MSIVHDLMMQNFQKLSDLKSNIIKIEAIKNKTEHWIANLKYFVDDMLQLKNRNPIKSVTIASQYQFQES